MAKRQSGKEQRSNKATKAKHGKATEKFEANLNEIHCVIQVQRQCSLARRTVLNTSGLGNCTTGHKPAPPECPAIGAACR